MAGYEDEYKEGCKSMWRLSACGRVDVRWMRWAMLRLRSAARHLCEERDADDCFRTTDTGVHWANCPHASLRSVNGAPGLVELPRQTHVSPRIKTWACPVHASKSDTSTDPRPLPWRLSRARCGMERGPFDHVPSRPLTVPRHIAVSKSSMAGPAVSLPY